MDAARALLDQLMTDRAVEPEIVAPPEMAQMTRPPALRPLPPPAPDPWDAPVPPAPPEGREYHVTSPEPLCHHCGATLAIGRDWCERCLAPR